MIKRFGTPPRAGIHYTQRTGAYAILPGRDGVLITHQERPDPEFQLPGGGIDPGESPVHALHREVFEETGWSIAKPRRIGAYRRFTYMPEYDLWAEKMCLIYVAEPVLRYGEPTEPGHTALWVSDSVAGSILTNSGDRAFVRQTLSGNAKFQQRR